MNLSDEEKAKLDPESRNQLWRINIEKDLKELKTNQERLNSRLIGIGEELSALEDYNKNHLEASLNTKHDFENRLKSLEKSGKKPKSFWDRLFGKFYSND